MRSFKKKSVAVVASAAIVLGSAGAAFAYWTAGGSGTGEATTGTNAALIANQTSVIEDMAPGVAAQDISGDFDNNNDSTSYVSTVTVSIASVVKDAGAVAGTCDATDYTLTNAVSTVNADIPAGTSVGAWGDTDTPTLAFNNKGTNQDQCKLATVNLAFAIA